ncbi:MAG: sensor histidine kinase [Pseudomonadales bacterium]
MANSISISKRFDQAAFDSFSAIRENLKVLCTFGIALHIAYYVANTSSQVPDSLSLRIVSITVLLPFVYQPSWSLSFYNRYAHRMYLVALFFVLPFFCSYVLVQSLSDASVEPITLAPRQIQLGFAVACIVIMIPDILVCVAGTLASIALGWLSFCLLQGSFDLKVLFDHVFIASPLWAFAVLASLYVSRNRKELENQKVRAMTAVGSNMAHELRTPLLGIRTRANSIADALPVLLKQYTPDETNPLSQRKLDLLRSACSDIVTESENASKLIDIFLVNTNNQLNEHLESRVFSVQEAARYAIENYPYASESERRSVHLVTKKDFSLNGHELLLVHILYNLIKNGLRHTSSTAEPKIVVRVAAHLIQVRDNGPGVPPENRDLIFNRFFTTDTARGSGIGLNFCKSAIQSLGGDISEDGSSGGARFRLSFPPAREAR